MLGCRSEALAAMAPPNLCAGRATSPAGQSLRSTPIRVAAPSRADAFQPANASGSTGQCQRRLRDQLAAVEPIEHAQRLGLAGEHPDDVAEAGVLGVLARDDQLTRGIPDEFVIRAFHDLPPL